MARWPKHQEYFQLVKYLAIETDFTASNVRPSENSVLFEGKKQNSYHIKFRCCIYNTRRDWSGNLI